MRDTPKRGGKIKPGHHWLTDDRTGIAHWDDQIVKQWDGLIVKKGSEDTRHPQEYVRSTAHDPMAPSEVVPEQGVNFDQFCGNYLEEYVPRTTIKRTLSIADELKPFPGIGAMEIGDASNECGHWLVVQGD